MNTSKKLVNVLLVEDHLEYADMFQQWLQMTEEADFHIETAPLLRDALVQQRVQPDVIVTDLGLPDADGIESVESLLECRPRTPLVVLTVSEDLDTCMEAIGAGAQDFIVKGRHAPEFYGRMLLQAMEKKAMEQTLRLQSQELDAFSNAMTHDLKSSLDTLNSLTDALRKKLPPPTAMNETGATGHRAILDRMEATIDQLDGLGEEVLRFVRYRAGTARVEPVSMNELAQQVLGLYSPRAERAGVNLRGELHTDHTTVEGDPMQLRHMLTSLLEHVIRDHSGSIDKVTLRLERDETRGLLVVTLEHDTPGADDATPKSGPDDDKPGLGPAIAARIAHNHHATLRVRTTADGTTRHELLFPSAGEPGSPGRIEAKTMGGISG